MMIIERGGGRLPVSEVEGAPRLGEQAPGDLVVVRDGFDLRWVLIGNVLGPKLKGGRQHVKSVLVHDVDPETLCEYGPRQCRAADPMLVVVAIVETMARRRAMASRWFDPSKSAQGEIDDDDIDPMTRGKRRAF